MSAALQMTGITKTFPGIRALSDVDLAVAGGEVHAIVGENGAGKSTLMKILAGVYQPDGGEIRLAGEPVRINGPIDAGRRGIAMVYQELNLVPDLTVAENIMLAALPVRRTGPFGHPALPNLAYSAALNTLSRSLFGEHS